MKKYILILLAFTFISCNPFISKDLRQKNRCNRKFERLAKKCPEIKSYDTTIVNFDTTIITNNVNFDTLIDVRFDTFEVVKDKFHLKMIRLTDTLLIDGGCDSDTIIIKEVIKVPFIKYKKIQLTPIEMVQNLASKFYGWVFLLLILYVLYKVFKKTGKKLL